MNRVPTRIRHGSDTGGAVGRRAFGQVRRLPSGRYQARYQVDALGHVVNAPTTFTTKAAAEAWLRRESVRLEDVAAGVPQPAPVAVVPTFAEYSARWLAERPLRASTARSYRLYLDKHVLPVLGSLRLDAITPEVIRAWHAGLAPDAPTVRARTYAVTKTILGSALAEDLIGAQPCRIRGASNARVATEVMIATPEQVDALYRAMPPRLALAVLFGAWCQLRVGETLALRRRDVDTAAGVVHVRRGVTWQGRTPTFGPPKTRAGERAVHFPEAMGPAVGEHLTKHVGRKPDDLLFPAEPGGQVPVHLSTFSTDVFKVAVRKTDLPATFRFHHLRHTGATLLAQRGGTIAELQRRLGHATPGIAMRYQQSSDERDRALARSLSDLTPRPESEDRGA